MEPVTNVTNTAPVATLLASAFNGTAPLNVTFALDATDADGDNLTWSFDHGEGNTTEGTALPATVNATYMAGNWTATFTVSDGTNETIQTLLVTVNATMDAAPAYIQHIEGAFDFGGNGCINNAYLNNLHTGPFYRATPDPETLGKPFTITYAAIGPTDGYSVHFWNSGSPTGLVTGGGPTLTGVVPEAADTVYINACGGLLIDFVYDAGDI